MTLTTTTDHDCVPEPPSPPPPPTVSFTAQSPCVVIANNGAEELIPLRRADRQRLEQGRAEAQNTRPERAWEASDVLQSF